MAAGCSHLVLDLLVGVSPLPLLWPFLAQSFKLPFGILPSAGKLQLDNYFLFFNLFIELGVLVPLSVCVAWWRYLKIRGWGDWLIIALLLGISLRCMVWAYGLSR